MAIRSTFLGALLLLTGNVHAQPECIATATLSPLDTWQTVSGNYDVDGWMIYGVTLFLGVNYVFKTGCGDGATADHNTVIEWMTPLCTLILANDDGCENGRSILSFNSFFDEMTLWIRVRGTAGQGGAFTMAYRSIGGAPGECNDCPSYDAQLAPSSLWQTVSDGYGNNGCQVYRVFGSTGMEYDFKTGCGDGATADHDTHLEVFGAAGCMSLIADDNGCESGRSTVTWTATAGGAFYVKVKAANGGGGDFTLAYRRSGGNGSLCSGCPTHDFSLTPGANWSTSSSSYLADGCQLYRFSVTEGYQYTFKTGCGNGASADHDTVLELFDAGCVTIYSDDNGCTDGASIIQHVATSTGFLYLKVSGANGAEGFYTLAHRRSGTCPSCPAFDAEITPTMTWQTTSGSYFNDGCWMYQVNVVEGHTYVFQTTFGNGALADHETILRVYDGACMPVDPPPWWAGYDQRLYHLAASTGVAYLEVQGVGGAFGAHTLAFRDLGMASDACAQVTPIPFGYGTMQLAGSLMDATSDDDLLPSSPLFGLPVKWYAFDVDEFCSSLIVSYCGFDPAWMNTLNMLTRDCAGDEVLIGTTPIELCSDGNVDFFFQSGPPGLYYLPLLYDPANSGDGAYVITVSCSSIIWDAMEEGSAPGWSVYPNPGSTEIWLQDRSGTSPDAQVRIYDPLGGLVQLERISGSPARIDTGALTQGIYFVEVLKGMHRTSFRWVRQ